MDGAGVDAGVLFAEEKKEPTLEATEEEEKEEEAEEVLSIEPMVADLLGTGIGIAGRAFMVEPRSMVFRDFTGGRGGVAGSACVDSFESLLLRPTIHHSPEGLLSTLIASVFCESMSPEPSA